MGSAARRNPRSFDGGKSYEAVGLARLEATCQTIRTPRELDALVARFPPSARDLIRALATPHCTFDPAAIAAEDARITTALTVAAAHA